MYRLLGRTSAITDVQEQIDRLAPSHVPVLIVGETGTGKEVCARELCARSGRTRFVPVNCAAFHGELLDDALFGHTRGAFTGAHSTTKGFIGEAHGGTLFLDELVEMPPAAQARLLRTLDSGEYRRLGSPELLYSDFRLLAATNEDVEKAVQTGRLRADLVMRLGAARIRMPPLRERPMDIVMLAELFMQKYAERHNIGPSEIDSEAMQMMLDYPWPGNVRQLRTVVEAASAYAFDCQQVAVRHLKLLPAFREYIMSSESGTRTLEYEIRLAEERAIQATLVRTSGNREQAAEILGISTSSLYRRLVALTDAAGGMPAH